MSGSCAVPSCRFKETAHDGPHKEIDGEREFWDDSMRPGYLRHLDHYPEVDEESAPNEALRRAVARPRRFVQEEEKA